MYFAYIRTQKFLSHSPLPKEMVQQNQEVKEVNQEDNESRKEGILYRRKPRMTAKKRSTTSTGTREQTVQTETGRERELVLRFRGHKTEPMCLSIWKTLSLGL